MSRVTWTDSKHGMFCNMKAFDFGRFEESYPQYHLVVFLGGLLTVTFCLISPTVFDTVPHKIEATEPLNMLLLNKKLCIVLTELRGKSHLNLSTYLT